MLLALWPRSRWHHASHPVEYWLLSDKVSPIDLNWLRSRLLGSADIGMC
ncbi:MAG: hypothetical protein AAGD09_13350 [Cyanobacteria bacterium P01_F01_bin.56]